MRLRELADLNKWPLAWTVKSTQQQSPRIVLDTTVAASDKYGFDARCRFVQRSTSDTHTPAASNVVQSVWQNVASTAGNAVVAEAMWDQLTSDLTAIGSDYAC